MKCLFSHNSFKYRFCFSVKRDRYIWPFQSRSLDVMLDYWWANQRDAVTRQSILWPSSFLLISLHSTLVLPHPPNPAFLICGGNTELTDATRWLTESFSYISSEIYQQRSSASRGLLSVDKRLRVKVLMQSLGWRLKGLMTWWN